MTLQHSRGGIAQSKVGCKRYRTFQSGISAPEPRVLLYFAFKSNPQNRPAPTPAARALRCTKDPTLETNASAGASTERTIELDHVQPQAFYGTQNRYFNLIRSYFPKLKITARGEQLKVHGDPGEIVLFEQRLEALLEHFHRHNSLSEVAVERIMLGTGPAEVRPAEHILYGINGQSIKARTPNQKKLVEAIETHDMVFAVGPAGTGKTYTAVALAVRALKEKSVRRIVLTRPAVEAGENLGFLPGDLKEKLDPYLQPLYDALRDMIPPERLASYLENGTIQIAPLAFMRGRTLDQAFVILDEAQNTTPAQMKMFLTRMGQSAKFVITGDRTQVDLPRQQRSGLGEANHILHGIEGIAFIELDERDVIRHRLVRLIAEAYDRSDLNAPESGFHPRKSQPRG
ncbi:AAA family ATPase [bacterium]|nr:AAA family ATPase [bacterium]